MTFDPFGDFATAGYLRNVEKETDLDIVKRLEHASFTTGLGEAFIALGKSGQLSYSSLLETHRILFDAVYPWAGQDRIATAPSLSVRKGPVIFANLPKYDLPSSTHWARGKKRTTCVRTRARSWAILPSAIRFSMAMGAQL